MKKIIIVTAFSFVLTLNAAANQEDSYSDITSTADFSYRPEYIPVGYASNDLFQDIKVSAVEGAAFGFLYSLIYIYAEKAIIQGTTSPDFGTVEENTPVYIAWAGAFAVINTIFNVLFFYDYNNEKPEEKK